LEHLLEISSNIKNLEKARTFLGEVFCTYHLDNSLFNHIYLGLSEAITNSIFHGNRNILEKLVRIKISVNNGFLDLDVEDEGDGFEFEQVDNPVSNGNILKENGRGIFLISSFAYQMTYLDGGRRVMIKYKIENEY
jgi:serine/threonine-protein kinase RsbW